MRFVYVGCLYPLILILSNLNVEHVFIKYEY